MASYAQKAGGGVKKKKKLNVLDIILERRSQEISYNLSKEELPKLLFKKMMIQIGQVAKIDTSAFGKIHVEMKENVKLEKFIDLPVFDIREGLRTKFYRPHHRQDTLVKISWLDLETPDELLLHILSFFGKPKSGVQYCTMREEEGESELAKLLNKITNGERQVWMEISTPLPSYAVIDGRRVKVWHLGQKRTCARCNLKADSCPGNANARHCEDNGGNKTKTEVMWKDVLQSVSYREWDGEEVKIVVEETIDDNDEPTAAALEKSDGIVLSNIEENATEEDIKSLLKGEMEDHDIEKIIIEITGNKRSRLITGVLSSNISDLSKKLNRKVVEGRMIHCKPHVPATPEKSSDVNKSDEVVTDPKNTTGGNISMKDTGAIKKVIPGLYAVAKTKNKKEKKKQKKEDDPKKIADMKASDFLLCPMLGVVTTSSSPNKILDDDFIFGDAESDSDALSDVDDEPTENFLTPINFKSSFGRRLSLSGSVSDLSQKRSRESSAEKKECKKSRSSSSQPSL